jgi:hypothetical protein
MTISATLMIINLVVLWWLFMSASNTAAKVFLFILALLNSWLALERFHVLPTKIGNRTIISTYHKIHGPYPKHLEFES